MKLYFGGLLGTVDAALERVEGKLDGGAILFTKSKYGTKPIHLTAAELDQVLALRKSVAATAEQAS
jgi:hypothetical protein